MDPSEEAQFLAYQQREKKLRTLRQQTMRRNARLFKLKRSNILYFCNLVAIFILQAIAIYFFKTGFLLSRSVLPNSSSPSDLSSSLLNEVPQQTIDFYKRTWGDSEILDVVPTIGYDNLFRVELADNARGGSWIQPKFKKAVLVIIDALRFDFVVPINNSDSSYNPNYHNNFPCLYDLSINQPKNSLLFKFIADPPTTTLQRLKGLTTGSLPTFIDAGSNFGGEEIDEDNFISQFAKVNKKNITLIGDDTWVNLFSPYLNHDLSWPYESLNVWDIHTVDNGVLEHIYPLLDQSNEHFDDWQLIVGHFLGLDHVGHRYGPDNIEMINKQSQMNQEMEKIINNIDSETLLVIMGDHGMDPTGNHGGDSKLELESTLFLYSKTPAFKPQKNLNVSEVYNLEDLDSKFATINQIDFVPSFSLLIGASIPFNNLGSPVNQMHVPSYSYFENKDEDVDYEKLDELINNIKVHYLSILNLQRYKLTLIENDGSSSPLVDQFFFDKFIEILSKVTNLNDNLNSKNTKEFELVDLLNLMNEYEEKSLEVFKNIWAKFNNLFIYIGITLLAFSLFIIILISKVIPSVVFNQLITEFLTVIILMIFFWVITFNATYLVLKPILTSLSFTALSINLLAVASGIIFGFLIIIFDRYNMPWFFKQLKYFANDHDAHWSAIALIFIALVEIVSYSSNSFLIFQDSLINFLLLNFGFYNVFVFTKKLLPLLNLDDKKVKKLEPFEKDSENVSKNLEKLKAIQGLIYAISFIVIQKIFSSIRTCREEQSNHCPKLMTVTQGESACQTSNVFSPNSLGLLLLVSLIFPSILKQFLNMNGYNSYENSAQLWIGKFLRSILLANWIYWCLDYIEFHPDVNLRYFKFSFEAIKNFKLIIARTVMGVSLIAGNFVWSKGPLCIRLVFPSESSEDIQDEIDAGEIELDDNANSNATKIIGLNNIYGSSYLLLVLNFFAAILVTNKPYSGISNMLLLYQVLNTLELISILELRNNMIGPIIFNLLGYSCFYATDHHITISSIKWELAFQLSDKIIFPISHIPLILNSFGPFIITSLSVILITIWKIPPDLKPISLLSRIIVNCLTLLMSQTMITLSSLFFTNWFKRHLMVWKVFVPCFLLNSLILLVVNFVIIFIGFSFGVTKLIHQINRIFGK